MGGRGEGQILTKDVKYFCLVYARIISPAIVVRHLTNNQEGLCGCIQVLLMVLRWKFPYYLTKLSHIPPGSRSPDVVSRSNSVTNPFGSFGTDFGSNS